MNSNKVQAITGFIVTIIIIGVILAIYFSTRTKKSDTGTVEEKVPNISISGINLANKNTETYMLMTEYYDLPELSKQVKIDVTVTISDSYLIETLKIRRTNGTNISEQNLDISDGTKTVSFEALTDENMASGHTIEVIYTTYLNTTEVIGASDTVTISVEQLSLASVEGSSPITLTVDNTGLQSDVRITRNYVVITLGTTDIFAGKKVYFAPVPGTIKGFKIMDTGSDVIIGKTFYIFEAGNKKIIGTEPSETASIEYITYTGGSVSLSAKKVNFQNKLFDVSFGAAVEGVVKPYTYYSEQNPSWSTCTDANLNALITHCTKSTNCGAIGRQSNGCWHMLKGDSLPAVSDTAFYAKYGTVLEKKNDFKLFYGGDGALGRDGRNACNMTDADKQDACIRDDKLQIIGSGNTCGHRLNSNDRGIIHPNLGAKIAPTHYSYLHFCNREYGIEYGLIQPNTGHTWHASGLTPEECRVKAVANGDNAYGMSTPTHPDVIAGNNKVSCWSRKIPGSGTDSFTGLVPTGQGGNLDQHIAGCTTIGKKVSNNCV